MDILSDVTVMSGKRNTIKPHLKKLGEQAYLLAIGEECCWREHGIQVLRRLNITGFCDQVFIPV